MKKIILSLTFFSLFSQPILASSTTNPANWQTYTDNDYHFTIQYPATKTINKNFSQAYLMSSAWSMQNMNATNNHQQHSLLEIQLQNTRGKGKDGGMYYYQAYVRVGVSSFPADVKTCEMPTNDATAPTELMINNKEFYAIPFSDAAMSQYNSGVSYRHAENNKCYSVEYVETGTNSYNTPNYSKLSNKNRALAQKIIDTFQLTGAK